VGRQQTHEETTVTMDLDGILARLERLEAENAALRREVRGSGADEAGTPAPTPTSTTAVSRRQLLHRAGVSALGAGIVAASAATLGRYEPASAADGDYIRVGYDRVGTITTNLSNTTNNETVFKAQSDGAGTGLYGGSGTGAGVTGSSGLGAGVLGSGGVGVVGFGARGGEFHGNDAAITLHPTKHAGHPHNGFAGDLVVDKAHRLWFCKGGTLWKQLA
jgi:hypothetical protein